jgi:hypothetical protein
MSEQPNNTERKNKGRPFQKGDARINRKGRPKTFDALRREALRIAGETLVNPSTGEEMSVAHAILRAWAVSGDPQAQKLFVEYAYGKVPNKEEITGADGGANKLIIEVVRRDDNADGSTGVAETSPETSAD